MSEPIQKITISIRKRSFDWMAYLNGDRRKWECAKSPEEAIGKLIQSHAKELGITVEL